MLQCLHHTLFSGAIAIDNAGSILVMGKVDPLYYGYQLTLVNASTGQTSYAAGVTSGSTEWADGYGSAIKFDLVQSRTMVMNGVTGTLYFFNSFQNYPGGTSRASYSPALQAF